MSTARRDRWIQVRVTEPELTRWSELAKEQGESLAGLVRVLLAALESQADPKRKGVDKRLRRG
jgi:hypothetical protein